MFSFSRSRRTILIVLTAATVLLLLRDPLRHALFAFRFAASLKALSVGHSGHPTDVKEASVRRQVGNREYEALVYHPAQRQAATAIVLVAGLSELGCYHPRLVALSRSLAAQGLMIVTPDVREFREFRISARPIDQILFWYRQVPQLPGGANVEKTGLAGISYSGTIALIAAARPEIRDTVSFIVAVGPYSNLLRCARNWFAATPGLASSEYYPTRFYAKWIIMLAALDMVRDEKERQFLQKVLENLLLQKTVPQPGPLTAQGKRWYELAVMAENRSDEVLSRQIEQHLVSNMYSELDPMEVLGRIKPPVYLIHGAYDDLIPPQESLDLHRQLSDSHLLITPFLSHTHPTDIPMPLRQKIKAAFEALAFCYEFSQELI